MRIFFDVLFLSLLSFTCILLVVLPCWAQSALDSPEKRLDLTTLCGYPGEPLKGGVKPKKDIYKTGDIVQYWCTKGYWPRGYEERTCLQNGIWSEMLPVCVAQMKVNSTSVTASGGINGGDVSALWDLDENTCISTNRSNTAGLRWKIQLDKLYHILAVILTPGKPTNPDGMHHLHVSVAGGKKDSYLRIDKYNHNVAPSGFTYYVVDGESAPRDTVEVEELYPSSTSFPMCEMRIYAVETIPGCGEPEIPINSIIRYSHDNKNVSYKCNSGFMPVDLQKYPVIRTCQINGTWSGEEIRCVPKPVVPENEAEDETVVKTVRCGKPAVSRHSKIVYSQDRRTIFYSCDPGYEPVGNPMRSCQDNGEWSGAAIICFNRKEKDILLRANKQP